MTSAQLLNQVVDAWLRALLRLALLLLSEAVKSLAKHYLIERLVIALGSWFEFCLVLF